MQNIYDQGELYDLPYKYLEISCLSEVEFTAPLLSIFQHLTHLSISESVVEVAGREWPQLSMPNLVFLELGYENYQFMLLVRSHRLRSFTYNYEEWSYEQELFEEILGMFLTTCGALKNLTFYHDFPKSDLSKFSFKLSSIEIQEAYSVSISFLDLLKAQKDSLEEIYLQVLNVDGQVINFIYNELNLKKLLDNHWSRHALDMKVNNSLNFLAVTNSLSRQQDVTRIEQLISSCHNLDVLFIEIVSWRPRKTLQMISSLLPRMKIIAFSFQTVKQLQKISKWIRSNNYHASLGFDGCWCLPVHKLLKEGSGHCMTGSAKIFVASSKENLNLLRSYGHVKTVESFIQIYGFGFDRMKMFHLRNVSMLKQEKRSKRTLVRIYIEHIVRPKYSFRYYTDYFELDNERIAVNWPEEFQF